jgi:signal transduction histidine kinase
VTSLRRRIAVPTLLLTLVVGAALGYLGWDLGTIAGSIRQNASAVRAIIAATLALTDAVDDEERLVALLAGGHRDEAPFADADERIELLSREIGALAIPGAAHAREAWTGFLETRDALRPLRGDVLAAARGGDAALASRALSKWSLMADRADALLGNFTAYHLRLLDRTVADLQRRNTRALGTTAAAVGFGLLLAFGYSFGVARTVVRPMEEMARAAARLGATGPPTPVAGAGRRDEIGVLARSFNEMTERLVAANAGLAQAVRARDEFISVASHELRTPITPLQLRVQQLLRSLEARPGEAVDREEVVRAARNLERHVGKLGKLVDNMLDVSRITSGRLTLRIEEVSLREVARDALERTSDELAAAGCAARLEADGEVRIAADRARLEQVIVNIAGNAAKYAPGAPVAIRVAADERGARVEIADAGPGIAPEDHERIFTRFERAVADRHDVTGLGLGLFIAREIVRAHGGDIAVRSDLGRGAAFTIRLPAGAGERRAPEPGQEERGPGTDPGREADARPGEPRRHAGFRSSNQ